MPKIEHTCRVRIRGAVIVELDMSAARATHMRCAGSVRQHDTGLVANGTYFIEILGFCAVNYLVYLACVVSAGIEPAMHGFSMQNTRKLE